MIELVTTKNAPGVIGPYSQGTIVNRKMIFTSGQLPIDPKTGKMPEGIVAQTRQSLTNIRAILEEAGSSTVDVAKTTVYLKDMNDYAAMNEVYEKFFSDIAGYPARSAVQVARLPKDALIEIEAIAVKAD